MYKPWEIVLQYRIISKISIKSPYKYKAECLKCWDISDKWYNAFDWCKRCKARNRKIINKWDYYDLELTWWECTKIDKEDYEKIRNNCWYKCIRWNVETRWKSKLIKLHRLIMNAPDWKVVDHINWDVLDNRKNNLRICTSQQNCCNKKASNRSKTWIKWVRFCNIKKKYATQITLHWKRYWGWYFNTIEKATKRVNELTKELHWDFSKQF